MVDNDLLQRIEDRSVEIGVVGLGYVGLPLAVAFAEAGFRVTGLDIDPDKAEKVRSGVSYVKDVPSSRIAEVVDAGRLDATVDADILGQVGVVIICVPTPLGKTKDPDISYVMAAADEAAGRVAPGTLVVMESTTYPGTTEAVLLPRLSAGGRTVGEDFFLAFSPERIDPGNETWTLENTPKIVGGQTDRCGRLAAALYGAVCQEVHLVSSSRAAEMVKLLENTFRAVNIALVNEVAMMCERLAVDTWEVIDAAATKPFGFMPFYPGPGLGGHCIPVDPHYLTWKVRTLDYQARLVELAGVINSSMPEHVARKVSEALNERAQAVKGSRILVVGVAYKRDVNDIRESPALDILRILRSQGAEIDYSDPWVEALHEGFDPPLQSVDGLPGACSGYDCVVVCTDHTDLDWEGIIEASPLLIDTRNVSGGRDADHVVRL